MAKPSKRELDLQRRTGSAGGRKGWLALGAVAVVGLFIALAVQEQAAAGGLAAFHIDDDPYLGNPDADVLLIGYESPHCSSCRHFHANILPHLEEYLDNGTLGYYFLQGTIMAADQETSIAQECALREGGNEAFWAFTDRVYARPGNSIYGTPELEAWLEELATDQGLDGDRLLTCLAERETQKAVSQDLRVGREQDVRGTPTFWLVVDGKVSQVHNFAALPGEIAAIV